MSESHRWDEYRVGFAALTKTQLAVLVVLLVAGLASVTAMAVGSVGLGFGLFGAASVGGIAFEFWERSARSRLFLAVAAAYRLHANSTTQCESAAVEVGLSLPTFLAVLDDVRRLGFIGPYE